MAQFAILVDTHCHLDFDAFDEDRDEVLARASQAGVVMVLNPAIDVESSQRIVGLAEQHKNLFAAVGVHPSSSRSWQPESAQRLKDLARHPKVRAIGEIGLDYYRDSAPPEMQKEVLAQQLMLAAETELPVIIHNREASADLMEVLTAWQQDLAKNGSPLGERPGVLHSFAAHPDIAEQAMAHNFYIGFTGPVTFKNAADLQRVAAEIPLERMLVETDSPFLSPHPLRGQRNEPSRVKLVAEKLAEIKGVPFEELAARTTANARALFRLDINQ
jgi:TatD DNase family protein